MLDYSGTMTMSPDELRNRLQLAMTEAKMDATTLARTVKRSPDYVRDFLNGRKNSIKHNDLVYMEVALSAPPGYLTNSGSPFAIGLGGAGIRSAADFPPPSPEIASAVTRELDDASQIPVYSAAEGGTGVMVVSTDPIDRVMRPWFMREVRDGFAVLIVGESMEPAFEAGDLAIVNPRLPAVRNKTMIFTTSTEGGEFKASIKRLLRWDADHWFVRQFNEPKDFALPRREWPNALRVVGKLEG